MKLSGKQWVKVFQAEYKIRNRDIRREFAITRHCADDSNRKIEIRWSCDKDESQQASEHMGFHLHDIKSK